MEFFSRDLKQFLKYFLGYFILLAVILAIFIPKVLLKKSSYYDSPNTERVYGTQRVFDYGNQLTADEERRLTEYIYEAEKKTCLDIVIVTLNQSLKDYAPEYKAGYTMTITPDKYVMVYADKFWEDNNFGYDQPQILDGTTNTGDGVILVDNVYREEETSKIYTWMGTTGKAEREYSSSMIDYALDRFYDQVEYDYYQACIDFVDCVVDDMRIESSGASSATYYIGFLVAIIATVIFYNKHKNEKIGAVTTNASTYLIKDNTNFTKKEDQFIRENTTKVYNPPSSSSSSGGGGHHSSGGGGSHGGGGHSR